LVCAEKKQKPGTRDANCDQRRLETKDRCKTDKDTVERAIKDRHVGRTRPMFQLADLETSALAAQGASSRTVCLFLALASKDIPEA